MTSVQTLILQIKRTWILIYFFICDHQSNFSFFFVFSAERKTSLGKDWHSGCLRCEKCNKTLTPGSHAEHEGKPYCHNPCYSALYGPGGFGRGGAESYVYNKWNNFIP